MNEQRWEELVNKVKYSLEFVKDYDDCATEDEINLIVSVLKNNIPFDVVSELSDNESVQDSLYYSLNKEFCYE